MPRLPPFLELLLMEAADAPKRAPTAAEIHDREILEAMSIADRIALSSDLAALSPLTVNQQRRKIVGRVFVL